METLNIGKTAKGAAFALPLDIVTKTIAILAQKRVGKSYLADVITEELLDAGQIPIVIDYTGAHWGLKASADKDRIGYEIAIFGGDHADIPLEVSAGEVVAAAIVENRFPAIIDLTLFRKGEALRFLAPFLETLYRRNREPIHLICDEADAYAPQKPFGEDARTLGAMQDIVRRGGIRGIGCTLITQRPQILNKDVLTQAEMLVAMRLMHPRDINAIEDWVAVHADVAPLAKMKASLPALPRGTAWFWSPAMGIFERVAVRERETFDSGATPKVGHKVSAPKVLAPVDVAKLGQAIAATVARAKENDPGALQGKIRELERALVDRQPAPPEPPLIIDRPVIGPDELDRLREVGTAIEGLKRQFIEWTGQLISKVDDWKAPEARSADRREISPAAPQRREPAAAGPVAIASGGKRRIMIALAQYPEGMGSTRLSLLTGISQSGGTWRTYMGELRGAGYLEGRDHFQITAAGLDALGPFEPLPTGSRLRDYWRAKLSGGRRRIFDAVMDAHPRSVPASEVARIADIELGGGTWRTYLGELRGLELVKGTQELRASDYLFR